MTVSRITDQQMLESERYQHQALAIVNDHVRAENVDAWHQACIKHDNTETP